MDRLTQLNQYLTRYGRAYRAYHGSTPEQTFSIIFDSNENLTFWVGETDPVSNAKIGDFWFHGGVLERLRANGTYRVVTDYYDDIPTSIINLGDDFFSNMRFIMEVVIAGQKNLGATKASQYILKAVWSDGETTTIPASSWSIQAQPNNIIPAGTSIIRSAKGAGNFKAGLDSEDQNIEIVATYGSMVAQFKVKIKGATTGQDGSAQVEIVGPTDVNEGDSVQYSATIRYSDGQKASVLDPAWSISPKAAGAMDSNGNFVAASVNNDVEAVVSCYAPNAVGGGIGGTLGIVVRDTALSNNSAPRWGVGAPGLSSWADFKDFTGRGQAGNPEGVFNLSAGPGQKMYYLYPKDLGIVDITTLTGETTESWVAGGTGGKPRTALLTDDFGNSVEFYIYETVRAGIGPSVWKAAFPVNPNPQPGSKTITAYSQALDALLNRPSGVLGVNATLSWDPASNNLVRVVSEMFADGFDPATDPEDIKLYDPVGNGRVLGVLKWKTGTTWETNWSGSIPLMTAMAAARSAFVARYVPAPVDGIAVSPSLREIEVEEKQDLVDYELAIVSGAVPESITVISSMLPNGLTVTFKADVAPTADRLGTLVLNGPTGDAGTYTGSFRLTDAAAHTATFNLKMVSTPVGTTGITLDPESAALEREQGTTLVDYAVTTVLHQAAVEARVVEGSLPPNMILSFKASSNPSNPQERGTLVLNGAVGNDVRSYTAKIVAKDALGYTFGFTLTIAVTATPVRPVIDFDPKSFVKKWLVDSTVEATDMTQVLFMAPVGPLEITGTVPPGLTIAYVSKVNPLDPDQKGVIQISGKPTTAGDANLTIKATDADGNTAQMTAQLSIEAAPVGIAVDPTSWTGGTQPNTLIDQKLANVLNQTPLQVVPTGLPAGLVIAYVPNVGAGGKVGELYLRGTSGSVGTVNATVALKDALANEAVFALTLSVEERRIDADPKNVELEVDEDETVNEVLFNVLNVAAASTSVISGTLPAGLTLTYEAVASSFPTVGRVRLTGKTNVTGVQDLTIRCAGGAYTVDVAFKLSVVEGAAIAIDPTTFADTVPQGVAVSKIVADVENREPVTVVADPSLTGLTFVFEPSTGTLPVTGKLRMSGKLEAIGVQSGEVVLTDLHGRTATLAVAITVEEPADLALDPTSAEVVVPEGTPKTVVLGAVLNRTSTQVTVEPALPAGVTVTVVPAAATAYPITGELRLTSNGVAAAASDYTVTVEAEDQSAEFALSYECKFVAPSVTVSPTSWTGTMEEDKAVDLEVAKVRNEVPTLSLASGTMPDGVTLSFVPGADAGDASIVGVLKLIGTPTITGSYTASWTLSGATAQVTFGVNAVVNNVLPMDVVSANLNQDVATGEVQDLVAGTVLNRAPVSTTVKNGALPPGLTAAFVASADQATGRTGYIRIRGTVTAANVGPYTATIEVVDDIGTKKEITVRLEAKVFMTANPVWARIDVPFGGSITERDLAVIIGEAVASVESPSGVASFTGQQIRFAWASPVSSSFKVKVVGALGHYVEIAVQVVVAAAPAIVINPTSAEVFAAVGVELDQEVTRSTNVEIEEFTITGGTMPEGLELELDDAGFGSLRLKGTPEAGTQGRATVTVSIVGGTAPATFTLTIDINDDEEFTVDPAAATATIGENETVDESVFTIAGPGVARRLSVTPALPAGVDLELRGNEVFLVGTATEAGTYNVDVEVSNNAASVIVTLELTVEPFVLTLVPATAYVGTEVGAAVQRLITVANGPVTYEGPTTGALAPGLLIEVIGNAVWLVGTPTATGNSTGNLIFSSGSATAQLALETQVNAAGTALVLAPHSVALNSAVDTAVASTLLATATGVAATSFALVGGTIPPGLTVSLVQSNTAANRGQLFLAGTPTEAGSFTFTVAARAATTTNQDQVTVTYVVNAVEAGGLKLDKSRSTVDAFLGEEEAIEVASVTAGTAVSVEVVGGTPFNVRLSADKTKVLVDVPQPNAVGKFSGTVLVKGTVGSAPLAIEVAVKQRAQIVIAPPSSEVSTRVDEVTDLLVASVTGDDAQTISVVGNPALPAGLSLVLARINATTSQVRLTGTPTATGAPTVTYKVVGLESEAQATVKTTVLGEGLTVDPAEANLTVREDATVNEQVAEVFGPVTTLQLVSGTVPTGLTVAVTPGVGEDPGAIKVTGAAESIGTATLVYKVKSADAEADFKLTLVVEPKFAVSPQTAQLNGVLGGTITNQVLVTAANGVPQTVTPTTVGAGVNLSIVGQTIVANGTVSSPLEAAIEVTVKSVAGEEAKFTANVNFMDDRELVLTPASGNSNFAHNQPVDALLTTGNLNLESVTLDTGTVPPGLSIAAVLNGNTVRVTGTPTTVGEQEVTFIVKAVNGSEATLTWEFNIIELLTVTPQTVEATADEGTAFDVVVAVFNKPLVAGDIQMTGQTPPGTLLSYDTKASSTDIRLHGTATQRGTSDFTVKGTDSYGMSATCTITVTVVEGGQITVTPTQEEFQFEAGEDVDTVVAVTGYEPAP